MNRSVRSHVTLGGVGLLLAALVAAGTTVAATDTHDSGAVPGGDAADAAQAATTQVVARRIVINGVASPGVKLLTIPGLGVLNAACTAGNSDASVLWTNTTGAPVDVWTDYNPDGQTRPFVAPSNAANLYVAYWDPGNVYQIGTQLDLGQGNSPGPRKTATISIHAYRSGLNAPCGFQATATTWHTP